MFKKFRESLGENQPISWPLYIIFGYILLPMSCFLSSVFIGYLTGQLNVNSSRLDIVLCGAIGIILSISISTANLFYKRSKAKKDHITIALQGINVIIDRRSERFKFCYECPACGKIWEGDNVPTGKRCPQDFLPLKEVDPIERDNFYDL